MHGRFQIFGRTRARAAPKVYAYDLASPSQREANPVRSLRDRSHNFTLPVPLKENGNSGVVSYGHWGTCPSSFGNYVHFTASARLTVRRPTNFENYQRKTSNYYYIFVYLARITLKLAYAN